MRPKDADAIVVKTFNAFDAQNRPTDDPAVEVHYPNHIITGAQIGSVFGGVLANVRQMKTLHRTDELLLAA